MSGCGGSIRFPKRFPPGLAGFAGFTFVLELIMPNFKVVLIEHGYHGTHYERKLIESAGGEFVDAEKLPFPEALRLCEGADGIFCRRLEITGAMIKRFQQCKIIVRYGVGTDN